MTTWIVVVDSSRGKIYVQDKRSSELLEKVDLVHPSVRLHGVELSSDRPGKHTGAFGQGQHAFDARTTVKDHEVEIFAREIAEQLETGRTSGQFEKLVLMAPPRFLGVLREQLSDGVRELVVDEIAKDLATHTGKEVQDRLQQVL